MRKFLVGLVAFGMLGIAADAATSAKKKSASKRATKQTVATHKTVGTAKTRTTRTASTASQRSRKAPVRRTTWRNRQLTPTPERYKEIQQALAAKGYLSAGEATGKWDDSSTDALK